MSMNLSCSVSKRLAGHLLALALLLAATVVGAAPTTIPGTRISFEIPAGFTLGEGFAGIAWPEAATSIVVAELPTRAIDMRRAMTPGQLASRGMAMVESQVVTSAIGEATLVLATQVAQGTEFVKMILVAGNDRETVMLTATAPSQVWPQVSDTVRATLLTATWEPGARIDPMASLGFRVGSTEDLAPARALAGAALLITARDPADGPERGGPYAVVARSAATTQATDLALVARARLARTDRVGDIEIREEGSATMSGMPAHELIASGRSRGRDVVIYQAMAFDGSLYYVLQGFVDASRADRFLPQFRMLAASFVVTR